MEMKIEFAGGLKVNAIFNNFTVKTDQPIRSGGTGTAPDPFSVFISSIGTCTGIYVLSFCKQRNIPTDNIHLSLRSDWNENKKLIETIQLDIHVGKDFPEKYKDALMKVASLCTVKRHLENPPKILMHIEP